MRYLGLFTVAVALVFTSCNKQKRTMKGLTGNWNIEQSDKKEIFSSGSESTIESISNCGDLVISDISKDSSEVKNYSFTFVDSNGDTIRAANKLYTDDKNRRIIFKYALCDSTPECDLIWTVDKSKKNKQIWTAYGVDGEYFYPTNNTNPSASSSWLEWQITLKRND